MTRPALQALEPEHCQPGDGLDHAERLLALVDGAYALIEGSGRPGEMEADGARCTLLLAGKVAGELVAGELVAILSRGNLQAIHDLGDEQRREFQRAARRAVKP